MNVYERARYEFICTIAEVANRPDSVPILLENAILTILRQLLIDDVAEIRQLAAVALSRLADFPDVAEQIVQSPILPEIVPGLEADDPNWQRPSCLVVRSLSRHSAELAQECFAVLQSAPRADDERNPLVRCLNSEDKSVVLAAASALAEIARHSERLATDVVGSGAIPGLIQGLEATGLRLQHATTVAVGAIAQHSLELAHAVIDAGGIAGLVRLYRSIDPGLKEAVAATLTQIAKHSPETAQLVVDAEAFPHALHCLKDRDGSVRKYSACLVRETAKHTQELSKYVIDMGGAAALVEYLKPENQNEPAPAVMAIGYIASFSQTLTVALMTEGADAVVLNVLVSSNDNFTKVASAWTIGQLGKHSPQQVTRLASLNALSLLLDAHNSPTASQDLKVKTKRALKCVIEKCTSLRVIEPLIAPAPRPIQKYLIAQTVKLLRKSARDLTAFIKSGAFRAVQCIEAPSGTPLRQNIEKINSLFSEETRQYYRPQHQAEIIQQIQDSVRENCSEK
jgi:3-methyladenine DNA glycosylase AlkD